MAAHVDELMPAFVRDAGVRAHVFGTIETRAADESCLVVGRSMGARLFRDAPGTRLYWGAEDNWGRFRRNRRIGAYGMSPQRLREAAGFQQENGYRLLRNYRGTVVRVREMYGATWIERVAMIL